MIFNNSKYTNTYFKIVNRARDRVLEGYSEKHHIIPRSLGGSDDSDNIAVLTAREHYVCHLLLTKMTQGRNQLKMRYALQFMRHVQYKETDFDNPKYRERLTKIRKEVWDDELREHRANQTKRLWEDDDYRARVISTRAKTIANPEFREQMRQRSTELWKDIDYRKKTSEARAKALLDPEYRARRSVISKKNGADPEFKKKVGQASKERWKDPVFREKVKRAKQEARLARQQLTSSE